MKYPLKQLREDFPDDDACLAWLVDWLYPDGIKCKNCEKVTKHHRVKARKSFSCDECGHHVHPMAGTIFHNSHVPLTDWFHAIWLMSMQKAGTSAKQVERELGVSYSTAWRMMHQIRKMMAAPDDLFLGSPDHDVEIDETFIHPDPYKRTSAGKRFARRTGRQGEILLGIVQRNGPVKIWHVRSTGARVILPLIAKNVNYNTTIHTDGYRLYRQLPGRGYEHHWIDHHKGVYWTEESHTQNIENVWSGIKRGIKGVYRVIGKKYIQAYADEYAWRYSNRMKPNMFASLLVRIERK